LLLAACFALPAAHAFNYDGYADVLSAYVDDKGLVDYATLKANRAKLDSFVASMGAVSRESYDTWTEVEKIAFWCNAYNAITLKYIIDHYPIQKGGIIAGLRFPENSIRQITGVWDKLKTPVLGEAMTLDHIEHEILRKLFVEPRIHMAIVCAALSCPRLRNEPYVGERLDKQLADQSRGFCASKVRIDMQDKRLYLSAIFDWFGDDFEGPYDPASGFEHLRGAERSIAHFVSKHTGEAEAEFLRTQKYAVRYLDYDWTRNEQ
jgi:hypothetical protein